MDVVDIDVTAERGGIEVADVDPRSFVAKFDVSDVDFDVVDVDLGSKRPRSTSATSKLRLRSVDSRPCSVRGHAHRLNHTLARHGDPCVWSDGL